MMKMEQITIAVFYCDECGKKITEHTHTNITYEGEEEMNFHSVYRPGLEKTCYDKHNEKMLANYKLKQKARS